MMRRALQMFTGLVGSIWSSYKKSFRSKTIISYETEKYSAGSSDTHSNIFIWQISVGDFLPLIDKQKHLI